MDLKTSSLLPPISGLFGPSLSSYTWQKNSWFFMSI